MSDKPASGIAPLYLWLLALLGLVLIFVSTLMPHETEAEKIFHEFVKELGIVLFAVLTISLLYEMFLAKKYHAEFLGDLREEIRKGESNAAACAHLGIDEIFPERGRFTSVHSLDKYARAADADAVIRIFGRSTHNLLSDRAHIFTDALSRGARVQLCILDPSSSAEELKRTQDVWPKDLPFALWNLREQLIPNIERERPEGPLKGTLEVRFHRVPMLDSFLDVKLTPEHVCAWDLSFGREPEHKHIFRVDPDKPLGKELIARYDHVWNNATPAYTWANGKRVTYALPETKL